MQSRVGSLQLGSGSTPIGSGLFTMGTADPTDRFGWPEWVLRSTAHTVPSVENTGTGVMHPTAELFTEKAWAAIVSAQQLAQQRRQQQMESEHLFAALLAQQGLDAPGIEASVRQRFAAWVAPATAPLKLVG